MGCSKISKVKQSNSEENKNLLITPTRFVKENQHSIHEVYEFSSMIGEGTYGKVFLAYHTQTKQSRAIKIISKRSIHDTKMRFKFINEVNILKMIDHPNIIKLYEFFEDTRNYYLVTDYLTGGELLDYIIKNKVISERETAKYMKQVLESIAYLHSKSIVHRDIKLENLIFESKDPNSLLKLIDFGLSVIRSPLKRLKTRKGTISYLAPEVFLNKYNEKCDVWAVGVIMYVLLSGKMPFGGRTDEEIISCIQRGSYKITGSEWVKISPEAMDLLTKLLETDASKRISSEQALNHVWLTINQEAEVSNDNLSVVLSNLISFRASSRLQRAVMCFIASQLISQAERRELALSFRSIDVNGNGKINENELEKACVRVWGQRFPKEYIKRIIKEIDIDGNGFIDYTEFIIASMNKEKLLSAERLEETFRIFDSHGSGKITANEIKEMLDSQDTEDSCWQQLISEVKMNGENGVDLKEFKNMMLSIVDT